MEKSTILLRSIREVKSQVKLLSPKPERQKVDTENHNLLEHKIKSRNLCGHQCQGRKI